jgi:hypothetical protein
LTRCALEEDRLDVSPKRTNRPAPQQMREFDSENTLCWK